MATSSLLLLLADGRFPAGAHAHSGGLEAAVAAGRVTDLASLESFLVGRLTTAGLVGAAFAAAAHRVALPAGAPGGSGVRSRALAQLDAELDARTAAPALRAVSRRQGRRCCAPDGPSGRRRRSVTCPPHPGERTSRWCSDCSAPPPG
ncbi:Urease accessory protein ureF [Micromonospora lupini str. Lupac 08]|uniref:Urease accessory protein ureF n=1 Tax=Micromonospora lupini str. Lupac 08 TaxID=1150864 RepID=I0L5X8_9ACTN|nr:urease accessory UreF family protein [Micromonospora lupini]CCH19225.1 Urease accessory protein ureF [Micromonospora lupini str. Lupac 08]